MTPSRTDMTPQLPPRLPEAPAEIARALAAAHEADVAEALSRVDPAAAAEVLSAFPFDFVVRVLEHPEFERRHEAFRHFATGMGVTFIRAMSPDQQAHLFRALPPADRTRFLEELDAGTRATLALLLAYAPTTAGGIMTTEDPRPDRHPSHRGLAVPRLLRLRPLLVTRGPDRRRGLDWRRNLRVAHRLDAAVRPPAPWLRPGQRLRALCGDPRGRVRPRDLLRRRLSDPAGHTALSRPAVPSHREATAHPLELPLETSIRHHAATLGNEAAQQRAVDNFLERRVPASERVYQLRGQHAPLGIRERYAGANPYPHPTKVRVQEPLVALLDGPEIVGTTALR